MDRLQYHREYYKKNKEKLDRKNREWALSHRDETKSIQKKFGQTPKGIYQCLKTNCRKRNKEFTLDKDEFVYWYNHQPNVCHYCNLDGKNIPEIFKKVSVSRLGFVNRLTIDRKDNGGSYTIDNIVLACAQCNRMKGEFLSYEEMLEVGKIIEKKWRTSTTQES